MAPEILTFMPNGDVTLTLIRNILKEADPPVNSTSGQEKNASALEDPVIDEDMLLEGAPGLEPETAEAEESILYYAPDAPGSENGPFYPPPPRAKRGSDASARDRSASPPASFWAALKRQAAQMKVDPVEAETPPEPEKKPEKIIVSSHEVQCVVSSRHMMLASRYFETILSGEFNEARTLRTKGHVEIQFLSEDLDTMIILLNIIHGASRKVPRQVNLEVLSKLAVLVSKFGMLETVEFFSDTWIDHLQRDGLPKVYNVDVLPLLFVFWVFDRPKEFKDMTKLTQRESDERLDEDLENLKDVKIPPGIIDAIKRDREFAMETAITVIHALITRYMDGSALCDAALDDELRYACDAMVLGSLLKSSRKIGIWPKPEAPFPGRKFKDLAKAIRSIRILDVCNKTSSRRWNSHGPSNNAHGLEDSIEASMKDIEAGLEGLELAEFAKKSEDYVPILEPYAQPSTNGQVKSQPNGNIAHHPQTHNTEEEATKATPKAQVKIEKREDPVPSRSPPALSKASGVALPMPQQIKSEPPKQQESESKAPPQPARGRSPPRPSVRPNEIRPEVRVAERTSPAPSLFSWPSDKSKDMEEGEVKTVPKQQQSSGFVQQEAQASPRNSVHQQTKPVSRSPPTQKVQVVTTPTTTKATATPPLPQTKVQEDTQPFTPRDVSQVLDADKKLNRTPSYPQIPVDREDVKSPAPAAPRVVSIEETALPEGFSISSRPVPATNVTDERKSQTPPASATPIVIKGRESPLKQVQAVGNGAEEDDEEVWVPPPQNFRVRKGKKTFSTRFS